MIVIVGCGILGQYILKEILQNTDEQVLCTYHALQPALCFEAGERVRFRQCDVTSKADLQALNALCGGERLKVFYCAACHNIDAVFEHLQQAHQVNVEGLELFFETMCNIDSLYFASTDCVYGESQAGSKPFCEADACAPINEYGRQKLAAEKIVLAHGCRVFRFSLLYGASPDKNRKTFYDKTVAALQAGEQVEMIDGLSRCAIAYAEAAKCITRLALSGESLPPILNICGERLMTKYELGLLIARQCGASAEQVEKISKEEGKKFFKDKRADCIDLSRSVTLQILMQKG